MSLIDHSSGLDPMDYNEETEAVRVGSRIRTIRKAKSLSQGELGSMVGLTADRIQKYENGARKPKSDMLKRIAGALGVETLSLVDPVVTNNYGAIHALFEMEDKYGITVSMEGGAPVIKFDFSKDPSFFEDILAWERESSQVKEKLAQANTDAEKDSIMLEYNMWKWSFPRMLAERNHKELKKLQIQKRIEKLQQELEDLEG